MSIIANFGGAHTRRRTKKKVCLCRPYPCTLHLVVTPSQTVETFGHAMSGCFDVLCLCEIVQAVRQGHGPINILQHHNIVTSFADEFATQYVS